MNIYIRLNTDHQPLRVIADSKTEEEEKSLLRKEGKTVSGTAPPRKRTKIPLRYSFFFFLVGEVTYKNTP
jgi:hypothetical protein